MLVVLALVVTHLLFVGHVAPAAAVEIPTIDLRVLVLDDDSPWVDGMAEQLTVEGVPFTAVPVSDPERPEITAAYLADANHAFFQAVIASSYSLSGLTAEEMTALRAFEAKFGVREVDMFNYPSSLVGMHTPSTAGSLSLTASVTAAGQANGFQYLDGPVPLSVGNYTYLSAPLSSTSSPPIASGASFTNLVSAPIPNSTEPASLLGVYSAGGVEQLIVTSAMNFDMLQFKLVAHGIISWATRGVHLGYNRNRMTFHVDDAFASVALWDADLNCTPGEDCPPGTVEEGETARMTPDDVAYAAQWQAANDYQLTLAFNGFYAEVGEPLTDSFVANRGSFRWLNHGLEHIYQGCIQDFSVVPWVCTTDQATGAMQYLPQADIYSEITANITMGHSLGLAFDPTEYLSGEHSGLYHTPQQPDDNPNFAAALTQAGILTTGADASREPGARQVGSAMTVPRHPTILYYNASTVADEVDEYNWLYTTRANGGSGYCEDNPATATCGWPMTEADYFTKIVPSDAAFNLGFILSNDPRPFYAHTTNLTGDRIAYPLLDSILGTYRAAFSADTPLLNQTQTQASLDFTRQDSWAASGMSATPSASASVTGDVVTVVNSGDAPVPFTVPVGTTVTGMGTLEVYGGELSGWLPAAATTTAPMPGAATIMFGGSPDFLAGITSQLTIATPAAQPAANISVLGTLPAGLNLTVDGTGGAAISGTATIAAVGDYPITINATNESGTTTVAATLRVGQPPQITSAAATTATVGVGFSTTLTSSGSPTAALSLAGDLPSGVAFAATTSGTATLAGSPAPGTAGGYPLTITATNWAGTRTQAFTLTVSEGLSITSAASATVAIGAPFSFAVTTDGTPTPTVSMNGALPDGVAFVAGPDGSATIAGTPAANSSNSYPLTITATNSSGTMSQQFVLTVVQTPKITSASNPSAIAGTPLDFTIATIGSPTLVITARGTLPDGVTFSDNGNGTATLAGTPTLASVGTYPITFTATNAVGAATQDSLLAVNSLPVISTGNAAGFVVGTSSSFTIASQGTPTPALMITGALPQGVSFLAAADGSGVLSGQPSVAGTYPVTVIATNAAGSATQALTITVREAPTFTSPSVLTVSRSQPVQFSITTTGSPAARISRYGWLPKGLRFSRGPDGTATISGTPARTGTNIVLLRAVNSVDVAYQWLIIRVS